MPPKGLFSGVLSPSDPELCTYRPPLLLLIQVKEECSIRLTTANVRIHQ
jgi:hypothetical protein